jgi:hypothetical protein
MEFLTILLTIIVSLGASGGLILDQILANLIETRTENVEELQVRVENTPSYEIIQGKAEKIRIASRGLEPIKDFRIEVLELETDPLSLNLDTIKTGNKKFREALKKPLQGGIRLVLTEEDLNQAINSKNIQAKIQKLISDSDQPDFEIINCRLNLLANNRLAIETEVKLLRLDREDILNITLNVGLKLVQGHKIEIIEPQGTLNGRKLSSKLLQGFADNINQRLDFHSLEDSGILIRLLQLEITDQTINVAAFLRIAANSQLNSLKDQS